MELPLNILQKCWLQSRRTLQNDLIRRQLIPKDASFRNSTFFFPPRASRIFPQSSFRSHSTNTLPKQTLSREIRGFSVRHQSNSATKSNEAAKSAIASGTTASHEASEPPPTGLSSTPDVLSQEESPEKVVPAYELSVTCRPCMHRSVHRISHQGYHHGTVMITCPSCNNRHVISDHLKIFSDKRVTIEDILRDKGELVQKGRRGTADDIEFWDDGSNTHKADREAQPGEQRRY